MNDQKNDRQKERQRMPQRVQENERELHSLNAYVLFIQDLHPLAFADVIFMTGKGRPSFLRKTQFPFSDIYKYI